VLIGCGAVSRLFYQPALLALARRGELRVIALVDPNAKARAFLEQSFPQARSVASIDEVNAPANTLAIVASPPRAHAAQTIACFARDWHVLCEKPMAISSAECEEMVNAAQTANRLLAVGLYKRFFPTSEYLRDICQNKTLGPLHHFSVEEGGSFRWPAASPSFFRASETPGGVLLDLGVHALDLLLWCIGEPFHVSYSDDAMGGLEANALVKLSYAGGVTGRVRLSRDWATAQRYRFEFERGVVDWTVNNANAITLQLNHAPAPLQSTLLTRSGEPALSNVQSFIAQLQNVLAAIDGRAALRVDGKQGVRALRLIELCYAQRCFLPQPWMPAAEESWARQLAVS
jgi:predicted dehydrogenase